MEIIDLSCPKCGGKMFTDETYTLAECEYCGHKMLFSETQRQALKKRVKPPEKPLTQTEKYQKKLAEEKKNAPAQSAQDASDEGIGMFLMHLFGFHWRLRWFFSFLILLAAAAGTYFLVSTFYNTSLQTYYLVAGIITTVVGVFCLWVSYRAYKSIPLGAGLGILIALLVKIFF